MSYITRSSEFYYSSVKPALGTAYETVKQIAWSPARITSNYVQNKAFDHFKRVGTPTTMALRAASELYEASLYIRLLYHSQNKNTFKLIDRTLLAGCMSFAAIADTYLFVMRLRGRSVTPGLELAVLPARLIVTIIGSISKHAPLRSTAISQLAVVVEKSSTAYAVAGYSKSAHLFSGVAILSEMVARSYFAKKVIFKDREEDFDVITRPWNWFKNRE